MVRRLVFLAILAGCSSRGDQPSGGSGGASGSGPGSTKPQTPADAKWVTLPVLYDAPYAPPPDAPPPPTREQIGTLVAPTPAVAIALTKDALYTLSALKAVVSKIDLATGTVTELTRDDEQNGMPRSLLLGADGLWWDVQKNDDTRIMRGDPAKPGLATVVFQAFASTGPMVMDATQIFIGGKRAIDRVDKKTADVQSIMVNKKGIDAIALDTDTVYWIALSDAGDSAIMKAKKAGGAATIVAKSPDIGKTAHGLVLDGGELYWSRTTDIVAMPKAGGKVKTLVTSKAIGELAIAGANLYWIENDEALATAPKAGGAPKMLGNADHAGGFASDGRTLYWGSPFGVRKLPI